MMQLTFQSRKVKLTEDEQDYFADKTDEDFRKEAESYARARESRNTMIENGLNIVDHHYNKIQEKEHHYNVSWSCITPPWPPV